MSRAGRFSRLVFGGLGAVSALVLAVAALRGTEIAFLYVAPLSGIAVSVLGWRLGEEARINATIVVIALGVTLYAAEAGLFLTESGHYSPVLANEADRHDEARRRGVPYDRRSRLEVVDALNGQGVPAVARVHPASMIGSNGLASAAGRVYPLSGVAGRPTVTCNESGEWTVVDSDEHGFNNPRDSYGPGLVDVVIVGDSYAYGACVPQGEETAAALRRSGLRVLNFGYGGNGPLIELATLVEYGQPFTPDAVLWFYYEGNDLRDLVDERGSTALLDYMDPSHRQNLPDRREELDTLRRQLHAREHAAARAAADEGARRRRRCVLLFCGLRGLTRRSASALPSSPADPPVDLLLEIVTEARDRVEAWGGRLHVVYLPAWGRYRFEVDQDEFNHRRDVLELLDAAGIDVIDYAEHLLGHPDPLSLFPFRARGHFTPEGYALLADLIETRLATDASP